MPDTQNHGSQTREVVQELLGAMSQGREVRAWLNQFSKLEPSRFAIIKIGGGTLQDELPTICSALVFLQKLGLAPIIVHGGGPQIDAALAKANLKTPRLDGLRVTDNAAMPVIAAALSQTSLAFISALNAKGVRASFCSPDTIKADLIDENKFGRVGTPSWVDIDAITKITGQGALPILTSVAIGGDGGALNVNADALVRELAISLRPQKIIFLTPTGAILDGQDKRISVVHLTNDFTTLMDQKWLQGGMKLKVQQIKEMLDKLPLTTSAAITKPDQLVKELFTHSGSGTLIRKGETIEICRDKQQIVPSVSGALIEQSFGRKLRANYWNKMDFDFMVQTDSNRALALVTRQNDLAYMDKFAVLDEARGEGLGAAVWQVLRQNAPNLFWRSRVGNPVNSFYFSESGGHIRCGNWLVFWIGQIKPEQLNAHIQHIANLPDCFEAEPNT